MVPKLLILILKSALSMAAPDPQMMALEKCSYDVSRSHLRASQAIGITKQTRPEMKLILRSVVERCVNDRRLHNGLTPSQVSDLLTAGYMRAFHETFPQN